MKVGSPCACLTREEDYRVGETAMNYKPCHDPLGGSAMGIVFYSLVLGDWIGNLTSEDDTEHCFT